MVWHLPQAAEAGMSIGLAQRLREGTWALHSSAERAGVMPALLRGVLPLAGFVALQRSLHPVYAALESGLHQQASPRQRSA